MFVKEKTCIKLTLNLVIRFDYELMHVLSPDKVSRFAFTYMLKNSG